MLSVTGTSFFLACVAAASIHESPAQHQILTYDVALEKPSGERFKNLLEDWVGKHGTKDFLETYSGWLEWLKHAFPEPFNSTKASDAMRDVTAAFRSGHPEAFAELETLSQVLTNADPTQDSFQLEKMATALLLYPMLNTAVKSSTDTRPHALRRPSACTSLVVADVNGIVYHGRSLDYEPRDSLASSTVMVNFLQSNKTAYKCMVPLPYISATNWYTCMRPGAFSLSVNARGQGLWNEHNTTWVEFLQRIAQGKEMLLGEIAEAAMGKTTYSEALIQLAVNSVVSSNYFILAGAGNGEGAIVTRFGNLSSADVWALGSSSPKEPDTGSVQPAWMRVQTNVDHWEPLGPYATHRRAHAVEILQGKGQEAMGTSALWDVYLTNTARAGSENRTEPEDTGVILRPSTIASLVMNPSKGDMEVRVWAEAAKILPPLRKERSVNILI